MSDSIKIFLDKLEPVIDAVETELNEWKENKNLQVPLLLNNLASKLNWDDKKVRQMDSVIRLYIHDHSDWHITRGAGGGIQRKSLKEKKDLEKLAKDAAKLEVRKMLDDKLAAKAIQADPSDLIDSSLDNEDDNEEDSSSEEI